MHEAAQRYREERAALGEQQSKQLEAMPSGKQAYEAWESIRAVGGEPPRWRKAPSASKAAAGGGAKAAKQPHRAAPTAFLRMKARDPSRFTSQARVAPASKVQLAVRHE